MSAEPHYTLYHPRWYRRRVSVWWWLQNRSYTGFVLRELTSVFVAYFAVLYLWQLRALAQGPEAYGQFLARMKTPLFLALVVINVADIVFAVDSVPAILAVTTDTFIVYTANIMAILGLRALYFALAAMVHRFHYLKYAMALVLIFIGGKIFWTQFVGHVHPALSLGVTLALLAGGIAVSLWVTRREKADATAA